MTLPDMREQRIRSLEHQLAERTEERDRARDMAAEVEERNETALRLHKPFLDTNNGGAHWRCETCRGAAPCATRRALCGADGGEAL